jgi:hypothetical protein
VIVGVGVSRLGRERSSGLRGLRYWVAKRRLGVYIQCISRNYGGQPNCTVIKQGGLQQVFYILEGQIKVRFRPQKLTLAWFASVNCPNYCSTKH